MAFTVKLQQTVSEGSTIVNKIQSYTCGTVLKLSEAVADSVTDQSHLLAIDISAMSVFYMVADQVLTIETNSGSSPQETFTLVANKPVIWRTADTAIFAGDVTALFVTNASGTAATLEVLVGLDV